MRLSTLFCGFALLSPLALCAAIPLNRRGHDGANTFHHIAPANHSQDVYPWPRIAVAPGNSKRHHEKTIAPAHHEQFDAPAHHDHTIAPAHHEKTIAPAHHEKTIAPAHHEQIDAPAHHDHTKAPAHHDQSKAPAGELPNKSWSLPSVAKRDHASQANSIGTEVYKSNHVDVSKREPEPEPYHLKQEQSEVYGVNHVDVA
ncbi:hypothetical protein TWF481_008228 [Arthrobotrys musiformis]|uniref:Uncharacterized protein n=1 Tax=Arthrobotrys musiformis TaxID=47236 RepID=A0AAV9W6N5_9PEZI